MKPNLTQILSLSTLAFGSFILTACQATPTLPTPVTNATNATTIAPEAQKITPEQLAGYHWKLVKVTNYENQNLLPLSNYLESNNTFKASIPTMDFELGKDRKVGDTQLSLNYTMGCNLHFTGKKLANNVLTSLNNRTLSTMVGCGEVNKAETQLASLLAGKSQLSLKQGDRPFLTQTTEENATLVWQGTPKNQH